MDPGLFYDSRLEERADDEGAFLRVRGAPLT